MGSKALLGLREDILAPEVTRVQGCAATDLAGGSSHNTYRFHELVTYLAASVLDVVKHPPHFSLKHGTQNGVSMTSRSSADQRSFGSPPSTRKRLMR